MAKAKANATQAIPELIRIATNPKHEVNRKEKHKINARFGWYRYNIRFALPVYDDKTGRVARHNIYSASMLVRHADNGQKYLYDTKAADREYRSTLVCSRDGFDLTAGEEGCGVLCGVTRSSRFLCKFVCIRQRL